MVPTVGTQVLALRVVVRAGTGCVSQHRFRKGRQVVPSIDRNNVVRDVGPNVSDDDGNAIDDRILSKAKRFFADE